MGKASSSKKVARAAGTGGGRTTRSRTPWTYYGVIAVIVVLGVAFTVTSRSGYEAKLSGATNSNASVAPKVGGTPWNEGYGIDACGRFVKPLVKTSTKTGITTAGNGVIHIAPKIKSAAGRNATLGVFAKSVGLDLTASEIKLPDGKQYINGDDCGGKQAKVYVETFPYVGAPKGALQKTDPPNIRLANNQLVTIAFVPPSDKGKIPAPPKSVGKALTKIINESTTTTTTSTTPTTASLGGTGKATTKGKHKAKHASSTTSTTTTSTTPTSTTPSGSTTTTTAKSSSSTTSTTPGT